MITEAIWGGGGGGREILCTTMIVDMIVDYDC